MYAQNDPKLPEPLPTPLGDPLLIYGRLTVWLILPSLLVAVVVRYLLPTINDRTMDDAIEGAFVAANFTLVLCAAAVLPRRNTNAIYLRSFRNDQQTGEIRAIMQRELGSAFRLSGIRDPKRRWNWVLRHLISILFIFRYASPKYMNLEAGNDWKQRLWRSLADARSAIIDVTELTPFVHEEVELAVQCMGLHRVLFVVDESKSVEEWQRTVLHALGTPGIAVNRVYVAIWPSGREFAGQVRKFAASLPVDTPGLNPSAYPPLPSTTDTEGRWTFHWQVWGAFVAANLIAAGAILALTQAELLAPSLQIVWLMPAIAIHCLCAIFLVRYFVEVGSSRQRLRLVGAIVFGLIVGGAPALGDWLAPREGVRTAAARTHSMNNLRQIGYAVRLHDDMMGHLPPPAHAGFDGKPLLSWRVMILPYLDQELLFRQFNLFEPWDGPNNIRLLKNMPSIYRSPYEPQSSDATTTNYQMFVGPGTPLSGGRIRYHDLSNPANTILVVETADAVPWTKPDDLNFNSMDNGGDLRAIIERLGIPKIGSERKGIPALMFDGTTRLLPSRSRLTAEEFERLVIGDNTNRMGR